MSKILLANWSVDCFMDDEREKLRIKEASIELAGLVSSLNIGSQEMPIEEYVQMARKEIVDFKYNMGE